MSYTSSPGYRQGGERVSSPPGLCTTYEGHNTEYLEHILPYVEYIEVTPDAIAQYKNEEIILHEPSLADLKSLGANTSIIVHGVGLSIGSYEGYSQYYIRLLDTLFEQLNVSWHSEHLAYTTVNGEHLGTMLALPKTDQVLDMICERVSALQTRYGLPFLLENVVHLLPDFPGTYSEAGFLNALTERTGCGLLLDVYNLECDAQNNKFDVDAFLDELHIESVREIHVACGTELEGFLVDVHTRTTRDSTIALAQRILQRAGNVEAVTFELLHQAIPALGYEVITNELIRLRQHLLQ
jgi:uncharacterized protein (UPF0276 family)